MIAVAAIAALVGLAVGVWLGEHHFLGKIKVPTLDVGQRQTLSLIILFLGEFVLTSLWVALYVFEWLTYARFGTNAQLVTSGQGYIFTLMGIHAGTVGVIAIGDVVSARVGDFFEVKRKGAELLPPENDRDSWPDNGRRGRREDREPVDHSWKGE